MGEYGVRWSQRVDRLGSPIPTCLGLVGYAKEREERNSDDTQYASLPMIMGMSQWKLNSAGSTLHFHRSTPTQTRQGI